MQTSLWEPDYNLQDGHIEFYPNFMSQAYATELFHTFVDDIKWQQDYIKFYGKEVKLPRLTSWYGDSQFSYSGITMIPNEWTPELLHLKSQTESMANRNFNGVLLNYYRDGRDSVAWHSDDEPEWGENPTIASVSLGEERTFKMRHKQTGQVIDISLSNGSLLVMKGTTQAFWEHTIPKRAKAQARINLTFRNIVKEYLK